MVRVQQEQVENLIRVWGKLILIAGKNELSDEAVTAMSEQIMDIFMEGD